MMTKQEFRVQRALGSINTSADCIPIMKDLHPDLWAQGKLFKKLLEYSKKQKEKLGLPQDFNTFPNFGSSYDSDKLKAFSESMLDWIEDQLE